jgi:hypothetical protein
MWFVYVFLLFFVASLVGVGIGIFRIHIPQTRWKSGRLNAPSKALLPKEYPADYITAVPEDIISYWWETEKGKSVSFRTSRIMHGAVKSAILYGNEKPVYVFSNTLPLDFFCEGSSLRGHERNMSLGYTCQVTIARYNIVEISEELANQNDILRVYNDIVGPEGRQDPKGYMHLISDMMRFLIVYRYGGTYLDLDQIYIRPLASHTFGEGRVVTIEKNWHARKCKYDKQWRSMPGNNCGIAAQLEDVGIPGECASPPLPSTHRFSLYSAVLVHFLPKDKILATVFDLLPKYYTRHCWGCLGPKLITAAFKKACTEMLKQNPASRTVPFVAMDDSELLMRGPDIEEARMTDANLFNLKGSFLEIDFHLRTSTKYLVGGLLKQILNYPNFTHSKTQLFAADEEQANDVNGEFSTLPWLETGKSQTVNLKQMKSDGVLMYASNIDQPVPMCLSSKVVFNYEKEEGSIKVHLVPCTDVSRVEFNMTRWHILKSALPGWRWSRIKNLAVNQCLRCFEGTGALLEPCKSTKKTNNSIVMKIPPEQLMAVSTFSVGEIRSRVEGHCLTIDSPENHEVIFAHNRKCIQWSLKHTLSEVEKEFRQTHPVVHTVPPYALVDNRSSDAHGFSIVTFFPPQTTTETILDFVRRHSRIPELRQVVIGWDGGSPIPSSIALTSEKGVFISFVPLPADSMFPQALFSVFEDANVVSTECIAIITEPSLSLSVDVLDLQSGVQYWSHHQEKLVGFSNARVSRSEESVAGRGFRARPDYVYEPGPVRPYNLITFDLPVIVSKQYLVEYTEPSHSAYRHITRIMPNCAGISMNILVATHALSRSARAMPTQRIQLTETKNFDELLATLTTKETEERSRCLIIFANWFPKKELPLRLNFFSLG